MRPDADFGLDATWHQRLQIRILKLRVQGVAGGRLGEEVAVH
jgi:hypothetical protein